MYGAQHFKSEEFRDWSDDMSPRLVTVMDVLRFMCGHRIDISNSRHALGRELGRDSQSTHNVDVWGEVLACDFFVSGVHYREQAEAIVDTMRKIGFTGIGVYTDTRNNQGVEQVMFHGDVRPTAKMGTPATWGRVWDRDKDGVIKLDAKGKKMRKYTTLVVALQSLPLGGKS